MEEGLMFILIEIKYYQHINKKQGKHYVCPVTVN